MRILFANDAGIGSPGLHALVAAHAEQGNELLVVAPHQEQSGASAAIGDLVGNAHIRSEQPDPGSDSAAVLEAASAFTLLGQVQGLPADGAVDLLAHTTSA